MCIRDRQYTKAFGLSVCGLSEMQAAGMTSIYTIGSICAAVSYTHLDVYKRQE